MTKLQHHAAVKKEAVRGWDILSASMGIMGFFLIGSCLMQPKAKINAIRLPAALVLMIGSVAVEHLREEDLESWQKAIGFQKEITTEKIRKDVMLRETIDDLKKEEELFTSVPADLWGEIAQRTGITPPNLEARQAMAQQATQPGPLYGQSAGNGMGAQAMEPPVQTATATIANDIDPTPRNYDPEGDMWEESVPDTKNGEEIQDCLIFAGQVESWFAEKAGIVPESLIAEWRSAPGIAIRIENGQANIVRSEVE